VRREKWESHGENGGTRSFWDVADDARTRFHARADGEPHVASDRDITYFEPTQKTSVSSVFLRVLRAIPLPSF
jgi:hypothetical protein